ncbi:helix-turn-helix domain-containing protein [Allokutzneria oryzae]|uniref:Helix-turn-helix domain-containing protein n=1 Tax=Allokutzneria oryzae TaxID=1378989 RepID=A0ABV5ZP26_9PSEU
MTSADRVSLERELPATFGDRLRALRVSRGLTQRDLAGEGLSSSYLSRLESGQRTPTPKVVEQLAARLGVPTESFAGLDSGTRLSGGEFMVGAARVMDLLLEARPDAALELLDSLRESVRDPQDRWLCEYVAAACAGKLGRTQDVADRLEAIEPMYRGLPPAAKVVTATLNAAALRNLGRFREAAELAQKALLEAEGLANSGFAPDQAWLLRLRASVALASSLAEARRTDEALRVCARGIDLVNAGPLDTPDWRDRPTYTEAAVTMHWTYAGALTRAGFVDQASQQIQAALAHPVGSIGTDLWCRVRITAVYMMLNFDLPLPVSAESLLGEVTQVRRASASQVDSQVALMRAAVAVRSDDLEAALEHAENALTGPLDTADQMRALMTIVRVSAQLGREERRLSALDELLQHLDSADPDEVRPALLKEVASLSVQTLRDQRARS